MRILLIVLFIMLPPFLGKWHGGEAVAQSALPKAVNDSLWAVWNNSKEADTNRLKAIELLCQKIVFSNPDSALTLSKLQLKTAKERNHINYEAQAYNMHGVVMFITGQYDSSIVYHEKSLLIAKKINDQKLMGTALGNIGNIYLTKGDNATAEKFYNETVEIWTRLGFKNQIAKTLGNIASIKADRGDYFAAIELNQKSLKLKEELNDFRGIASTFNNIGNIYKDQMDYVRAIENHERSLEIEKRLQNNKGISQSLNNIGVIYYIKKDYAKALEYYKISLQIRLEMNDKRGIASAYNNIGAICFDQLNYDSAMYYYNKSLLIQRELDEKLGISEVQSNISKLLLKSNRLEEAYITAKESYAIAVSSGSSKLIMTSAQILYEINKILNRSDSALVMHEVYIQMRDSILSERNQKEVIRHEFKYQFEKKELAIQKEMELSALKHEYEKKQAAARTEKEKQQLRYEEELKRTQIEAAYAQRQAAMEAEQQQKDALAKAEQDKKDAIATEQLRRKNQQRNAFIGGFALTLGLAGVSYRSYRRKKRDNTIITAQKEVVEKKNHAILESITYARKLQEAVLPPPKVVKEFFADSFLLYLPRDIVSGDFYWMESYSPPGKEGSGEVISLFALGDCTGHGVPGAMLSVMGLNGLNRALNELHITQPADFLTQLTKDLHDAFQRSDSMVRDGMDLSICALDPTNRKLTYAGANNPLWIARKGEIIVHKPNKRPVGHHDMEGEGFSQVTIDLQEGDTIYLMTDGYADQLGGPNGLKMMTKVFRERLAALSSLPLPQQREQLIADLDAWKGAGHQTDDVCVMGVRV